MVTRRPIIPQAIRLGWNALCERAACFKDSFYLVVDNDVCDFSFTTLDFSFDDVKNQLLSPVGNE